jgi:hypothetical protein
MRTIRASEIGTYIYCQRAWWYQTKGYSPNNQDELASGNEVHLQHSRKVLVGSCLRIFAYVLLIISIILLATHLTGRLL